MACRISSNLHVPYNVRLDGNVGPAKQPQSWILRERNNGYVNGGTITKTK